MSAFAPNSRRWIRWIYECKAYAPRSRNRATAGSSRTLIAARLAGVEPDNRATLRSECETFWLAILWAVVRSQQGGSAMLPDVAGLPQMRPIFALAAGHRGSRGRVRRHDLIIFFGSAGRPHSNSMHAAPVRLSL
jgi:hypothetical protein